MVKGVCLADFIWIFKNGGRRRGFKQTAIIGPVKYLLEHPHYRVITLILSYHTVIGEYCPKRGNIPQFQCDNLFVLKF